MFWIKGEMAVEIREKQLSAIIKIVVLFLASLLLAININTFVSAGELIPGGFTGVTLFMQRILLKCFNIHVAYTAINFAINVVPAVICYKKIGKKFTIYSCVVVVLTAIFTDLLPHYSVTNDLLLICVFI